MNLIMVGINGPLVVKMENLDHVRKVLNLPLKNRVRTFGPITLVLAEATFQTATKFRSGISIPKVRRMKAIYINRSEDLTAPLNLT